MTWSLLPPSLPKHLIKSYILYKKQTALWKGFPMGGEHQPMGKERWRHEETRRVRSGQGQGKCSAASGEGQRRDRLRDSTNGGRSLLRAEADLAAMGRVLGIEVGTSPAITTLRAGARTSGQTSMLGSALGGIRFAHPNMLFNLLRAYRIAMPGGVPRDWRSHLSRRRRVAAVRGPMRWAEVLVLGSRWAAHSRTRRTTIRSCRRMTVPPALRVRMRRVVTHSTRRHRVCSRARSHLVSVNRPVSVRRVSHHGVV
ncbi:hypothetical protein ASPCADRAFT_150978 [Aspergillus carbonarius ITEM 5010]|uniref:Uncharacterized protein n=1 Tax=Aspergillus carbonarius (strain ITEM 5010) TaxID=602072 RepID=A0A1R3RG75_ASPC5|nr:hypothetical protein ASPCADRAFT_150978 [Aspergillus carbonarius ITEM 5010]